jgi:hypothetical protein
MGASNVMNDWFLTYLNIKLSYLLAGAAGGIVRAFLIGSGFYAAFSSVIIGTLTAVYMTQPVAAVYAKLFGFPMEPNFLHGVAFVVGLTSMLMCEGFVRVARRWAKEGKLPTGGA